MHVCVRVCACSCDVRARVCARVCASLGERVPPSMSAVVEHTTYFPDSDPKKRVWRGHSPRLLHRADVGDRLEPRRTSLELVDASSSILVGSSFVSELPPTYPPCSCTSGRLVLKHAQLRDLLRRHRLTRTHDLEYLRDERPVKRELAPR